MDALTVRASFTAFTLKLDGLLAPNGLTCFKLTPQG